MQVVHVVPRPSIFEPVIQEHADRLGHDCVFYEPSANTGVRLRSVPSLFEACRRRPGHLFVFHRVPHATVLLLSLLLRRFHYALLYWGEDYYSAFISEAEFEAHCLAKSPMLKGVHYARPHPRMRPRVPQAIRRGVGLSVLRRAAGIVSLCPKQFRIVREFHYRIFRSTLRTPQLWIRGYSPDDAPAPNPLAHRHHEGGLTVLICHSAAKTAAHQQSLALLREYQRRWKVPIHVCGFLSYSGGDDAARARLERELVDEADFATSVHFERSFLSRDEVSRRLTEVDIAVFSCLRDEGVSLLTQFVKLGGVVSFNRFSIDYDFFRAYARTKLLDHEQFLESPPDRLRDLRSTPPPPPPRMLEFDELSKLHLRDGKLGLPPVSRPF